MYILLTGGCGMHDQVRESGERPDWRYALRVNTADGNNQIGNGVKARHDSCQAKGDDPTQQPS